MVSVIVMVAGPKTPCPIGAQRSSDRRKIHCGPVSADYQEDLRGGQWWKQSFQWSHCLCVDVRWSCNCYFVSTGVLLTGFMDASTDSRAGHEGLRANKTATQSILSVLFCPIWFAQTKSDFPDPCCNVQSPSLLFHIESRFPRFRKPKNDDMGYIR